MTCTAKNMVLTRHGCADGASTPQDGRSKNHMSYNPAGAVRATQETGCDAKAEKAVKSEILPWFKQAYAHASTVMLADHFDDGPMIDILRRVSAPYPVLHLKDSKLPGPTCFKQSLFSPYVHPWPQSVVMLNVLLSSRSWFELLSVQRRAQTLSKNSRAGEIYLKRGYVIYSHSRSSDGGIRGPVWVQHMGGATGSGAPLPHRDPPKTAPPLTSVLCFNS
eukprot:gene2598-30994_t